MNELSHVRYLLLQVRKPEDPMRPQEVRCFCRALETTDDRIGIFDLLGGAPTRRDLKPYDVVLLGGSGDFSVAEGGPWLPGALDGMRELETLGKPTFASCWGFQAMAKALGGRVVTDMERAEVGTHEVSRTADGAADPVFASLGDRFWAQMGHQDIVDELPSSAILLASTARVRNQAFAIPDKPIYCTQFHPELNRAALLQRVIAYPQYVERIAGLPFDEFTQQCRESPETDRLLLHFVRTVLA